jgi:hypothetical protein
MRPMHTLSARIILPCVVACCGCAGPAGLSDHARDSRAAIARAVDEGAEQLAPHELALAREKIALSDRWMAAHDYKPAEWLVEQAGVDAELATVKAAAARANASPMREALR